MEGNSGEDLGVGFGALRLQADAAVRDVLSATFEDEDDVESRASACASQHHFHGAWGEIAPTGFRCSIHHHRMAGTCFGHEAHPPTHFTKHSMLRYLP
jgi:hypothetical protein